MLKKIPCYYYQNNVQKQIANIDMVIDDEIVSRYTGSTVLYTWDNIEITSLRNLINTYLEYNLITDETPFYIGTNAGQGVITDAMRNLCDICNLHNVYVTGVTRSAETGGYSNITVKTLNDCVLDGYLGYSYLRNAGATFATLLKGSCPNILNDYLIDTVYHTATIYLYVFGSDIFTSAGVINPSSNGIQFKIEVRADEYHTKITYCRLSATLTQLGSMLYNYYRPALNLTNAQDHDIDNDNPYNPYNDPYTGGGGDFGDPDGTDPTDIPGLPTVGASDFITIYGPTSAQLTALSQFLWSADTTFNIDNFKKLYSDPSECLIGLNIVPCAPSATGTKHIKFGNIDTEVSSTYYTSQWAEVDCGSAYFQSLVDSFMDYSPYVKVQVFLPYIGFVHLNIDEIIGASLHIVYHVDVVSGDLVCFIKHSKRGVIYSFSGNCCATIPVTGSSYGSFLNKYYSNLAQVIPSMGAGALAGGAAGAAAGGLNTLFKTAETVMLDRKPMYSRSGTMSGASAIMGVQKPFVIIERPNISVPDYVQKYAGLSSNKTVNLGSCKGFTQVDFVHIDGVAATSDEIAEIERLLHEGVIL